MLQTVADAREEIYSRLQSISSRALFFLNKVFLHSLNITGSGSYPLAFTHTFPDFTAAAVLVVSLLLLCC
jgi:hypothetical protein